MIDPQTDQITNVLEDKNNHVIDSLRYACEAVRRTIKSRENPLEGLPIEPRTNYWNKGK